MAASATAAARRRRLRRPDAPALARTRAAVPLGLGLLVLVSVVLRTVNLGVGYWIDEGLSVGIADRPLLDIPGTLRLDGSPPAYYMLLHLWIRLVGDSGEEATHLLSLLLAVLAIPVAFVLVRAVLGTRAGWMAAVLVAVMPFLTIYAQETRMYALVVVLSIVATSCFLAAFAFERGRRWALAFAVAQAAVLWTHNWALFLGAGLAVAWAFLTVQAEGPRRRALVRDGLTAFAVIAVLYAAWVPTLLFQAANTAAPWANPPDVLDIVRVPHRMLGEYGQFVLLLGAGAGLAALFGGRARRRALSAEQRAAVALGLALAGTVLVPWLLSQVSPSWSGRYLAVTAGPLLALVALGLARAGRLGVAAAVVYAAVSLGANAPEFKSNVREVAQGIAPSLAPGDLVVSTQPEQVPVLHHYLAEEGVDGVRFATLGGPVADLGVTDWRGGEERLEATSPAEDLAPLLDGVAPGSRVVLVQPDFSLISRWQAPWTETVRHKSAAWEDWMRNDARFRVVGFDPTDPSTPLPHAVRAMILYRESIG